MGLPDEALDGEVLEQAARTWLANRERGMSPKDAVVAAINEQFHAARLALVDETGRMRYEDIDDDWPFDDTRAREEDPADEAGLDRPQGERGDAGAGEAQPGAARGGQGRSSLDDEEAYWTAAADDAETGDALAEAAWRKDPEIARFDEPAGPEAKAQADSLAHDAALDPETAKLIEPFATEEIDLKAARDCL